MQIDDVLKHFDNVKRAGDQWSARCPAHDDKVNSLSIALGRDNETILLTCHAGCDYRDIVYRAGLQPSDLTPSKADKAKTDKKEIVAIYEYCNGAQKVRYKPKDFRWRQPDGNGGWQYNRKGLPHCLYVAGDIDDPTVFCCEGEKDCNTLHDFSQITTVCSEDGASVKGTPKWRQEYTDQLRGKTVYTFQDNDDAGRSHAIATCNALTGAAEKVYLLDLAAVWPEIPQHGDVTDLFNALGSTEAWKRLTDLVNNAEVYQPQELPAVVDEVEVEVIPDPDLPGLALQPSDFSDVGEAQILGREYVDRLRYSPATDWIYFDGVSWTESKSQARKFVHTLTQRQIDEADRSLDDLHQAAEKAGILKMIESGGSSALKSFTEDQTRIYRQLQAVQYYRAFAVKRRDSRYITSTLQEAAPLLEIDPKQLDANPFLLNCPGNTYDLRYGSKCPRKHEPEDFITQCTAVDPSTEGMELWLKELNAVFQGNDELIDFFQLCMGLTAVGRVYVEKIIILNGGGSNGKSTILNSIAKVLGTYSGHLSADALTVNCRRNVKPEMAEVRGKRLIVSSELAEGQRLNTSTLKQLASTDDIYAEKKYRDPFFFSPSHTLILCTNFLPKVGTLDTGTWRRLAVVPFNAKFEGENDRKNYTEYLVEHAGGSILTWIMEGAEKVIEKEFQINTPKIVAEAIGRYKAANDWLQHFIDDICAVDKSYQVGSGELYSAYRQYSINNGEHPRSTTDFYTALEAAGYIKQRDKSGMKIYGLKIINNYEGQPP